MHTAIRHICNTHVGMHACSMSFHEYVYIGIHGRLCAPARAVVHYYGVFLMSLICVSACGGAASLANGWCGYGGSVVNMRALLRLATEVKVSWVMGFSMNNISQLEHQF